MKAYTVSVEKNGSITRVLVVSSEVREAMDKAIEFEGVERTAVLGLKAESFDRIIMD